MNKEKTAKTLFVIKLLTLLTCISITLELYWFRTSLENWVYYTAQLTTLAVYLSVHYILPRIVSKSISK